MSKKANPKVIGSFVIGAIVLSIIGIMLLGGGSFLERRFEGIMYFDESISGLDVGAPVDFQGVRIGTVTEVWLEFDRKTGMAYRPVKFQIEDGRIRHVDDQRAALNPEVGMESLVQTRGFRARLASQSLLTGRLKIELGFFPDRPIVRLNRNPGIWEMPTVLSPLSQVKEDVAQLPLAEIVNDTHRAIQNLSDLIDPEKTGKILDNLNGTMERLESVLVGIDSKLDPLLTSITKTSDNIGALLDPQTATGREMTLLIEDLKDSSNAMRRFIEFIEQHPESLLRGKK